MWIGVPARLILTAMLLVVFAPGVAGAAQGDGCGERYPEASWSTVRSGDITVEVTGIPDGIARRFANEAGLVDSWLASEIGPTAVTVCLVGADSTFDHHRYREGSQLFHIVSDLEERFFAMNTDQAILYVAPALAYGLSQHALYQNNGDVPFPEPISTAISHWYRARIIDRLPYYHRAERGLNLFETESIIDWTAGEQATSQSWDPETNISTIGDFVGFAVAEHGSDVLLTTEANVWSDIESDWRTSLRFELIGTADPSSGWKGGLIVVISVLVVATAMVSFGLWRKYRRTAQPSTGAPIPGFFSD
jgi:hypothetical protein